MLGRAGRACRHALRSGVETACRRPNTVSGVEDESVAADRNLPRIDWFALPAGAVADRALVPSGSLARIAMGAGPRVVLVPGATGSKEDFLRVMPLLAVAGHRVEAFDLAGQYQSATAGPEHLDPPRNHYDLDLFVDDVIAVLANGSTPAHLLGYSFAGTVAALAAARCPDLVATLTLLSTPPIPGRTLAGMKWVGPLARFAPPELAAVTVTGGVRLGVEGGGAAWHRFTRARLAQTRPESVRDIMASMAVAPDLAAPLRATGLPMLIAAGTRDLWPLRRHRAFAAAAGARFAVYRAGHSPVERAPHQLVRDMLRLFAEADADRDPPGGNPGMTP